MNLSVSARLLRTLWRLWAGYSRLGDKLHQIEKCRNIGNTSDDIIIRGFVNIERQSYSFKMISFPWVMINPRSISHF